MNSTTTCDQYVKALNSPGMDSEMINGIKSEVWIKAWCAVAGSEDCGSSAIATKWADAAVQDYSERFLKP